MSFLGLFRFKVLSQSTTTTMSRCFPSSFLNHHNRSLLPSWCSSPASQLQLMSLRFKSGVKTNSGAKKRFRVRGSGSIKRNKSGASHNTGYKTRHRSNRLGSSTGIEGKAMERRVRRLLAVSGRP